MDMKIISENPPLVKGDLFFYHGKGIYFVTIQPWELFAVRWSDSPTFSSRKENAKRSLWRMRSILVGTRRSDGSPNFVGRGEVLVVTYR